MSTLSKIKSLLLSPDEDNVVLGTELLINLCDPDVVLPLLKPFRYRKHKLIPPPAFKNKSLPGQQIRAYLYVLSAYAELSAEIERFCLSITTLTIKNLDSFEKVCGFTKLENLSIFNLDEDADTAELSIFEGLKELKIYTAPAQDDLTFVSELTNLKSLDLNNWPDLASLEALAAHPSLETITLRNCPSLKDDSTLSCIPNLKRVQAHGCPLLTVPKL